MQKTVKVGIIICDRYRECAGGKCFRALKNKEGAFDLYEGDQVDLVGYTTCGGCPGGNVEYAPQEMQKNGAEVIHFATGLVVGYPPCPYIGHFRDYIRTKFGMQVVIGTHPIPQKYYDTHMKMGTWKAAEWQDLIAPTIVNETLRRAYD